MAGRLFAWLRLAVERLRAFSAAMYGLADPARGGGGCGGCDVAQQELAALQRERAAGKST